MYQEFSSYAWDAAQKRTFSFQTIFYDTVKATSCDHFGILFVYLQWKEIIESDHNRLLIIFAVITISDFDCDESPLIKWKIGTHFNDDTSPVQFYLPQCVSQFRQAKFDNSGSILSLSQFLLLPQLPKKWSCFKSDKTELKNNHLATSI